MKSLLCILFAIALVAAFTVPAMARGGMDVEDNNTSVLPIGSAVAQDDANAADTTIGSAVAQDDGDAYDGANNANRDDDLTIKDNFSKNKAFSDNNTDILSDNQTQVNTQIPITITDNNVIRAVSAQITGMCGSSIDIYPTASTKNKNKGAEAEVRICNELDIDDVGNNNAGIMSQNAASGAFNNAGSQTVIGFTFSGGQGPVWNANTPSP